MDGLGDSIRRGAVRTVVPAVVGWLVGTPVAGALRLDEAGLTPVVAAGVMLLWYLGVRWLESHWPGLGILLGSPGAPAYGDRRLDDLDARVRDAVGQALDGRLDAAVAGVLAQARHPEDGTAADPWRPPVDE